MSRYNGGQGQQPIDLPHGVDPANHGWNYTGHNSQSRVIFYEREGVKADLYSTGTLKTSMDHPKSGPTQLFRRDLSTNEHQACLDNPRQHTGKGYYTKK